MAHILVTGGSGLIGWCAADSLLQMGHEVTIFDLYPNQENIARLSGPVSVVSGNLTDLPLLLSVIGEGKITHVIHLAAAIYDQSARDPAAAFRVNIGGTANLFDACCALGVSRVVWTSSSATLAAPADYDGTPVTEDYRVFSRGPYGASKYGCEVLAAAYRQSKGLDSIGIRPNLTFGLGRLTGGTGTFNSAIREAAFGRLTRITDMGSGIQGMYNKDMGDFLARILFGPKPPRDVYNSPSPVWQVAELAGAIKSICPDAPIELIPLADYVTDIVPLLDTANVDADLPFTCRYSLEAAIEEMVAEFRRAPNA